MLKGLRPKDNNRTEENLIPVFDTAIMLQVSKDIAKFKEQTSAESQEIKTKVIVIERLLRYMIVNHMGVNTATVDAVERGDNPR